MGKYLSAWSQAWWYPSLVTVPGRQRQGGTCEFEASQGYIIEETPVSINKTKKSMGSWRLWVIKPLSGQFLGKGN